MSEIPQFGPNLKEYTNRPGVYAVVIQDNKILLVEANEKYHLPGGGLDDNENSEQALMREVSEETGYELRNLKFLGQANQFVAKTDKGPLNKLCSFYSADLGDQKVGAITEKDHRITWLSLERLPATPLYESIKWAIERYLSTR